MRTLRTLASAALALLPALAAAQMPDLGAVVTSSSPGAGVWYKDRYLPATFASTTHEGRDAVEIGISSADASPNRPAGFNAPFYNTQGRKYDLGLAGAFSISADLYVESGWTNAANGYVRTDLWGTMTDNTNTVTAYSIIGFTNYDGAARFRGYDSNGAGTWMNAASPVVGGAWYTLGFAFDGLSTVSYSVNGTTFASFDVTGSTQLADVMLQAYNFGQDFGANDGPSYSAYWSNTQVSAVPEPATLALMGSGLLGVGAFARRRRNRA